jgi:2-dehydro-3-deoxyphosphogluconate aldolase/(4S)-4-hydroxy-2-oxoglutarate aldolase
MDERDSLAGDQVAEDPAGRRVLSCPRSTTHSYVSWCGTVALSLTDLTDLLGRQRLLPVLRERDVDGALRRVESLLAAGCPLIELTTSIPGWDEALAGAIASAGADASPPAIGLGTVTTAVQAEAALDAGAAFLVSPFPAPDVRAIAQGRDAVLIEGGFAPSEVAAAVAWGPAKVFPAHVGGPTYIRSLLAILPDAILIPTGGISLDQVGSYLGAGALAVGIGSGLPDDAEGLLDVFRQYRGQDR